MQKTMTSFDKMKSKSRESSFKNSSSIISIFPLWAELGDVVHVKEAYSSWCDTAT